MKTLKKIIKKLKEMFEGNQCRFTKRCELYQTEGVVCNSIYERFPNDEKAYCGRYRSMEEDKEKGE